MKIYYAVGAIFTVVVIYFVSALVPLPWYIYPPFILLFVICFYWDAVAKYIPIDTGKLGKYFRRFRPDTTAARDTHRQHKSGKRI